MPRYIEAFSVRGRDFSLFEVMDDRSSKEILQKIKVELLKQADTGNQNELAAAISYLTQNVSEYKFPEIMNMITENRSKIAALLKITIMT